MPLINREMQITTTVRYHLTPDKIVIIKNQKHKTSIDEAVRKSEPLHTVDGNTER